MSASNAVIIYSVTAILLSPDTAIRRIVICDNDSQITAQDGPCKLNTGETYALMPMLTYLGMSGPQGVVSWLLNFLGL